MSRRSCRYFLPSFQLLHAVRLPFPFVSCRSFRYLLPLASTLLSCSSCSSFPFNSSISLHPSFCCKTLPFHSLLPSFRFKTSLPFVCLRLLFQVVHFMSSFLPCGCKWLWVAAFLNFNYCACCNNVTVSNPGLVRLSPWNLRKYGSDGLGAPQYSFHWQQGSPHIPEPTNTLSGRLLDSYLWGVSVIFQGSGRLCETSFDNVVFLECGQGRQGTDWRLRIPRNYCTV